jgi:alginate O-acetyltransferase complex protein AlgI
VSITEFWRRWHMSLSRWFRDYVYVPLGGNRLGTRTMVRSLLFVFLLTGAWHGAAWTFVLWGLSTGR